MTRPTLTAIGQLLLAGAAIALLFAAAWLMTGCAAVKGEFAALRAEVQAAQEQSAGRDAEQTTAQQTGGLFQFTKQTTAAGVTGGTFAVLMAWREFLVHRQIGGIHRVLGSALARINEEPA